MAFYIDGTGQTGVDHVFTDNDDTMKGAGSSEDICFEVVGRTDNFCSQKFGRSAGSGLVRGAEDRGCNIFGGKFRESSIHERAPFMKVVNY